MNDALPEKGRELDIRVIREVMGWCEWNESWFSPSTSIADAWRVVEQIQELRGVGWADWERFDSILTDAADPLHRFTATEAAERICRAALRALSGEER